MTALPVAMPAAPNPHEVPSAASTQRRRDPSPGEGDRRFRGSDFDRTLERAMQRSRRDRPDTPSSTSGRSDAPDQTAGRAEGRTQDPTTRAADTPVDVDEEPVIDRDADDTVAPVAVDAASTEPAATEPAAADPTLAVPGTSQDAAAGTGADVAGTDGTTAVVTAATVTDATAAGVAPTPAAGSNSASAHAGDTAASLEGVTGSGADPTPAADPGRRAASGAGGSRAATIDPTAAAPIDTTSNNAGETAPLSGPAAAPAAPATATAAATGESGGTPPAPSAPNAANPTAVTPSAVQSVVTPPTPPPATTPAPATTAAAASAEPPADPRGVELGDLGSRLGASLRRNERTQTLTIQLHPAELGAITVEARLVDGVTHLHLAPDSASTTERLASTMADLRHQLARAGVDLGDLDLGERRDRSADDATSNPSRRGGDTARRADHAAGRPADGQATDRPPTHHRGGLVAIDL